jgi:uncharacterized membrane protein YhhN
MVINNLIFFIIALFTAIHLIGHYFKIAWLVYLFKPLSTIAILLYAGQLPTSDNVYQQLIVIGLMFSLFGDIFLMLPKDKFLAGLVSFFFAHLCYIAAFARNLSPSPHLIVLFSFLLFGCLFWGAIRQYLGNLKIPVAAYTLIISLMGALAMERWLVIGSSTAYWGMWGALLFIISDGTLAINRFVKKFPAAQAIIICSYYLAQILIAKSING